MIPRMRGWGRKRSGCILFDLVLFKLFLILPFFLRKQYDWRTRRDRTETRNIAFQGQMKEMVTAYVRYCAEQEIPTRSQEPPQSEATTVEEVYDIQVVDMFGTPFYITSIVPAVLILCTKTRPTSR